MEPNWRRFFLVALLCQISQEIRGATTIIVSDGHSLPAAVAAASHGDILQIDSNQFFPGTLSWQDKHLMIQAGPGFQPTVASIENIIGGELTGGTFRGLRINGNVTQIGTGTRFSRL